MSVEILDKSVASKTLKNMNNLSAPYFIMLVGLVLIWGSILLPRLSYDDYSKTRYITDYFYSIVPIFGMILILISTFIFSFRYLRGDIKREYTSKKNLPDKDIMKIVDKLSNLETEIRANKSSDSILSDDDRQSLIESINNTISKKYINELTPNIKINNSDFVLTKDEKEILFNSLGEKISTTVLQGVTSNIEKFTTQDNHKNVNVKERINDSCKRLDNEVNALTRRGNFNLAIGATTTLAALGILAYLVFDATKTPITNEFDIMNFIWNYAPRISIAIFIEVFSFFFLKLYRNCLEDIKFFQNEISNIEMQTIALEVAMHSSNNNTLDAVIKQLSMTERNFRLQKGESTVDIERSKLDHKGLRELTMSISNLINAKN